MLNSIDNVLRDLSEEQRTACKAQGNILLTACPGSGKTRTLTHRLAYLVAKKPESYKLNIAITYTNRAADEIIKRLDDMAVDSSTIWAGTIHQFCMRFIIRPYAMYSKRLCKGYKIIDEYCKQEYGYALAQKLGLHLDLYTDPFEYKAVQREYEKILEENKEIDFDMILRFSNDLLFSNPFIASNLSSTINSILVDEFQDTNELQYLILSTIYKSNRSIELVFAGDTNQAIYGSLGGVAKNQKELEELYDTTFNTMSLTGCYRSTKRLVDLYRKLEITKTNAYSVAKHRDECGHINYCNSVDRKDLTDEIATIISSALKNGIEPSEICVVAPQWSLLFGLAPKLRELLPDISFDAPDISPIKYDPLNPLFLISQLLFMPAGKNVTLRKRIATEFITSVRDDFRITISDNVQSYDILYTVNGCKEIDPDGIVCLKHAINRIFKMLNVQLQKEKELSKLIEAFFSKIASRVKRYSISTDYESVCKYFKRRKGVVINTIHGVKGEEYTTVIAFGLLNGYLPNWEYIIDYQKQLIRKNETCKMLYVLCSRAKKNLYLFSERGHKTKKNGKEYTPTDELSLIKDML